MREETVFRHDQVFGCKGATKGSYLMSGMPYLEKLEVNLNTMKTLAIIGLSLFVSTAIHAKSGVKSDNYSTKKTDSLTINIPDTTQQTIVFPNPFLFLQLGSSEAKKD